jgi:hypothetical protein
MILGFVIEEVKSLGRNFLAQFQPFPESAQRKLFLDDAPIPGNDIHSTLETYDLHQVTQPKAN